ncbi:MAG: sel1 repeat family protein [Gammaproteobacteria bacterium]|nr:sel1 repeat family protein [Gammaproteobacteria bacterium]
MKQTKKIIALFIVACSLLHITAIKAVDLGSFGARIFQFQKKLAEGGNTLAQYKLGTLYEFGVSVEPNVKEATVWYKKAAEDDYTPAILRLTYLEIQQTGFDEAKHSAWFDKVIKEVQASEANALILFGQMHRHGIAVDKNLNKAVLSLQQASSLGHTEVDSEIDAIKQEIAVNKQKRTLARKQLAEKKEAKKEAEKKAAKKAAAKSRSKKQVASYEQKKIAEKEAKRRKYAEAMRKLYKESLLIQQQQEWAESEDTE